MKSLKTKQNKKKKKTPHVRTRLERSTLLGLKGLNVHLILTLVPSNGSSFSSRKQKHTGIYVNTCAFNSVVTNKTGSFIHSQLHIHTLLISCYFFTRAKKNPQQVEWSYFKHCTDTKIAKPASG